MIDYPNWIFSAFAGLGFVLSLVPLPWHLEAWNTGTCLYMLWAAAACLCQFIDSIVWSSDAINRAPVWCDISTRVFVGFSTAIPAASLCINRRLYHISTANAVTITKAEKRRAIMVDLAIGLGLPLISIVLYYIVQGHRFDIYERIGCFPFTYNTPVAFALVYSIQPILGLISAVYCVLSIRSFNKRRLQFQELLSANSNLNGNRYFRLMALAGTDMLFTIPCGIYRIYVNASIGIYPWLGWADTHWGFSRVDQIPYVNWTLRTEVYNSLEFGRWMVPICAIVFFAFFGFADEARKHYRQYVNTVAKHVGVSTMSTSETLTGTSSGSKWKFPSIGSTGGKASLPIFVTKQTTRKRDSFGSFTSGGSIDDIKNEKSFGGDFSLGAISLGDVGGVLADYKPEPASPISSSASTSRAPSVVGDDSDDIEISSVRRASRFSIPPTRIPDAAMLSPPRHAADAPSPATQRNSVDVV